MNQVLMRAVAESAAFVGLSGDDVIKPDAAVAYLEDLASTMKELKASERRTFLQYMAKLSAEEQAVGRGERAEFLASLCANLGLVESGD